MPVSVAIKIKGRNKSVGNALHGILVCPNSRHPVTCCLSHNVNGTPILNNIRDFIFSIPSVISKPKQLSVFRNFCHKSIRLSTAVSRLKRRRRSKAFNIGTVGSFSHDKQSPIVLNNPRNPQTAVAKIGRPFTVVGLAEAASYESGKK